METSNQKDQQNIFNNAADLLVNGRSPEEVANHLVKVNGFDEGEANNVVTQLRQQFAQAKLDKAKSDIRTGGLWLLGGLVITIVSYSMVSEGGGTYLLCWGPIIFGGIQLFKGLEAEGKAKRELEETGGVVSSTEEVNDEQQS
jgi:hypothetical protein